MIDSFSGRWAFLSNFHPSIITYQGIKYPTVEHYYVAMKVKDDQIIYGQFFTVADCRELISKVSTPGKVKKLGRSLKVRKDWDSVKLEIMEFGLREKFKDLDLREMLLQTGSEVLIEGNWWNDIYWGVCKGVGENNLGKLLMKIRSEISNPLIKSNSLMDMFKKY